MKKYFLISIFGFALLSFQANAQCCAPPSNTKTIVENSNQGKGNTVKLKITGMTCAGCAKTVYDTLQNTIGVLDQSVEYPGDLATIDYDFAKTNPEKLIKVIEKLGYQAKLINNNN